MKTKYRNSYLSVGLSASSARGKVELYVVDGDTKYVERMYFDYYDNDGHSASSVYGKVDTKNDRRLSFDYFEGLCSIWGVCLYTASEWYEMICNEPEKEINIEEYTVTVSVYERKSGWKKRKERVFNKISKED